MSQGEKFFQQSGGNLMIIGQKISTIDLCNNLDLILRHLQPPIFPRTVSTKNTVDRQIVVYNEEEILSRFRDSDFIDCRINSYPNTKDTVPLSSNLYLSRQIEF